MTREYGRSLRGERLRGSAPFRRRGNQTLIAGLSWDGIVAPRVISGVISGAMHRAARRLKAHLERIGAGTFDQLIKAIGSHPLMNFCS